MIYTNDLGTTKTSTAYLEHHPFNLMISNVFVLVVVHQPYIFGTNGPGVIPIQLWRATSICLLWTCRVYPKLLLGKMIGVTDFTHLSFI